MHVCICTYQSDEQTNTNKTTLSSAEVFILISVRAEPISLVSAYMSSIAVEYRVIEWPKIKSNGCNMGAQRKNESEGSTFSDEIANCPMTTLWVVTQRSQRLLLVFLLQTLRPLFPFRRLLYGFQ